LATNVALRRKVEQDLQRRYSPEQIAGRLRREFPDDVEMRVPTETIYQSLYVQTRGALRRDLARCLRTGRAVRRPCRKPGQRKNRIPNMINISERPAEATDRAVPGHWEGDLIIAKRNLTAIATLVERTTGYTMLVHLPDGYKGRAGPRRLGRESTSASRPTSTSTSAIHMRRGATNENTNGLLRQYFPKGSDLSAHSAIDLEWVATELNDRPRKRLRYAKPIEEIAPSCCPDRQNPPNGPRRVRCPGGGWSASRSPWRLLRSAR
jgi:IS30 family transposase